ATLHPLSSIPGGAPGNHGHRPGPPLHPLRRRPEETRSGAAPDAGKLSPHRAVHPGTGGVFLGGAASLHRAVPHAGDGLSAESLAGPYHHSVRGDDHLRAAGPPAGQSQSRPGRGALQRQQSPGDRRALPPGDWRQRQPDGFWRRLVGQAVAAGAREALRAAHRSAAPPLRL
ncbi:MAG: Methylated-DNA--protein-cysteine methyltransferase, partial [uncultured Cytophagales bacterium]